MRKCKTQKFTRNGLVDSGITQGPLNNLVPPPLGFPSWADLLSLGRPRPLLCRAGPVCCCRTRLACGPRSPRQWAASLAGWAACAWPTVCRSYAWATTHVTAPLGCARLRAELAAQAWFCCVALVFVNSSAFQKLRIKCRKIKKGPNWFC